MGRERGEGALKQSIEGFPLFILVQKNILKQKYEFGDLKGRSPLTYGGVAWIQNGYI
ncbi:hypothetical protein X928_09810 [Petrotoga miotherma DSM 10691]|uniref:Uncharacterized protein n=1 Tax=Petrotoga miotherma DSM 10691 TaxID=1434326 RepID=A0A2K1P3R7_9BACT|nr:hypothetical protein X928_09810 [Petrotoga miotherma DSM 10691]